MSAIRVLVVDDSALMRKMIPFILSSDPDIEVVGTAMDGHFALKKISELKPDVITLDVDMPTMDGIETLRRIITDFGTPTIMVSSITTKDAELTFKALEIGAFDYVAKPHDAISVHIKDIATELIEKIKSAVSSPLARLGLRRPQTATAHKPISSKPERYLRSGLSKTSAGRVLAIGISTGGPNALTYLLPQIPGDFPAGIVIVQHMPAGFTDVFAKRLNSISNIEVKEAREGDVITPGKALIARGDRHLKVKRLPLGTIAVLSDSPRVSGHKPSADVLFSSVAEEYGSSATGLIMTGMGSDGAKGIGEIKKKGGMTIAQDEKSCIVFGMPKSAIMENNIMSVVTLEDMGEFLVGHFNGKEAVHDTRIT